MISLQCRSALYARAARILPGYMPVGAAADNGALYARAARILPCGTQTIRLWIRPRYMRAPRVYCRKYIIKQQIMQDRAICVRRAYTAAIGSLSHKLRSPALYARAARILPWLPCLSGQALPPRYMRAPRVYCRLPGLVLYRIARRAICARRAYTAALILSYHTWLNSALYARAVRILPLSPLIVDLFAGARYMRAPRVYCRVIPYAFEPKTLRAICARRAYTAV